MRPIFLTVVLLLSITSTARADQTPLFKEQEITATCALLWGEKAIDFDACVATSKAAYSEYWSAVAASRGNKILTINLEACEHQWRGQWTFIKNCALERVKGMATLTKLISNLESKIGDDLIRYCEEKHGNDLVLVSYCAVTALERHLD